MRILSRKFKKYFIPHPENDHKPQILRFRTVALVCLVMVLVEAAFIIGPSYLISRSKLFGIIVVNALVDGTNQARVADKLPALRVNPLLQAAAQEKANDMAVNGYFAHTSPAGLTPWYWFMKVGYDFTAAGENLAVNFSDSQDVTNAWMNSPGHRANILNGTYTEIGMATAQGTYEGAPATYVVEEFGASAPAVAPAAINAAKPKQTVIPVRVVIATTTTAASGSASVAVKGAETQNNPVQNAVAAPHSLANDFYLFVIGLFAAALALDIFIKIRIQHPKLIFGGVLVIALAAMFIVLNQQGGLMPVVVL